MNRKRCKLQPKCENVIYFGFSLKLTNNNNNKNTNESISFKPSDMKRVKTAIDSNH